MDSYQLVATLKSFSCKNRLDSHVKLCSHVSKFDQNIYFCYIHSEVVLCVLIYTFTPEASCGLWCEKFTNFSFLHDQLPHSNCENQQKKPSNSSGRSKSSELNILIVSFQGIQTILFIWTVQIVPFNCSKTNCDPSGINEPVKTCMCVSGCV